MASKSGRAGDLSDWLEAARKDLRGEDPATLRFETDDGIEIKPLYTAADLEALGDVNTLPGLFPFVRGPRATMFANRPWTIRQYAGYSTAEESNAFYRRNLAAPRSRTPSTAATSRPGRRACPWPSTWPPTAVTTPITRASPEMSERPAWRSTPSRT
jgi:hypothetical protein